MSDIYESWTTADWFEKWGKNEGCDYYDVLKKEASWCRENDINFTPEVLIRGKAFPKLYDLTDLIYIVAGELEQVR